MEGDGVKPSASAAEALFNAALALPAPDRADYLARACASDVQLRQRVETLLRALDAPAGFLPERPGTRPAGVVAGGGAQVLPAIEQPGDTIGRYKLLQKIGEGARGVVYMAEHQGPVRRRVALKVIKPGLDTRQVLARFEAERQALALMDHPNIARVLDAGATGSPAPGPPLPSDGRGVRGEGSGPPLPSDGRGVRGEGQGEWRGTGGEGANGLSTLHSALCPNYGRPYFVTELVHGIKITDYCDRNDVSTTERLNLFIQVCRAIQHGHQKGIIHRAIKPSNILITLHDGVPLPKVVDFGVAKATQGRLTEQTLFTALGQLPSTPAYLSPEQSEVSLDMSPDIDTRSDIYSLGVLLYELLTGQTPFDTERLAAAGVEELRRIIREEEPPRPSTRFSALNAQDQTTVAKHRQVQPPKLLRSIHGDLDWIAMKCLHKDRTRRYETANELARDIERHLHSEPVAARPPNKLYRFRKFVRRNKLAFAAGVTTAALVIGLVVSTWLLFREKAARHRAVAAEHQNHTDTRP